MRVTAKPRQLHAAPKVGISRYFALYLAQAGWIVLGVYLLRNAYWPSTCHPDGVVDVYRCSFMLAAGRGWVEAALMTWLWSTPLLVGLEISRRVEMFRAKR
jgi:hypothetical protein